MLRAGALRRLLAPRRPWRHGAKSTKQSTTLLSRTANATLLLVSVTLFSWPLADLYLGPKLSALALTRRLGKREDEDSASDDEEALIVASSEWAREAIARRGERPYLYFSLRTASSPHDLLFAVVGGVYNAETLGVVGVLAASWGIWWTVALDLLQKAESASATRAVSASIILNHIARACEALDDTPLVVIDHFDVACTFARQLGDDQSSRTLRVMLWHLGAWAAALAHDRAAAHVVIALEHANAPCGVDHALLRNGSPASSSPSQLQRGGSSFFISRFFSRRPPTPAPSAALSVSDFHSTLRAWLY